MLRTLALLIVFFSCGSCCITVPLSIWGETMKARECEETYTLDGIAWSHYPVRPNGKTPRGTPVDVSGQLVDLARIDALTAELDTCLRPLLKRPVSYCGFVVKVANDAATVNALGREAFPCPAGLGACTGMVQPPNIVVVTRDLGALKHELIHLIMRLGNDEHDARAFACQSALSLSSGQ